MRSFKAMDKEERRAIYTAMAAAFLVTLSTIYLNIQY